MSQEPLFSVVIPTRNRARLLRYALQSALEQTFDDYEIVVSNNYSQDDTEQVVKGVENAKVRYVKTDRTLSMPDHWEFALEQACGEYVTYLCDDDAWCPEVLQRVADVITSRQSKLVAVGSGLYYGDNWWDELSQNVLVVEPHSGETRECNSRDTLRYIFECGSVYDAPRMLNSFCHRETILRVRAESGRVFLLCPDYSFPALMLTDILMWIYIDEPLRLQGVFAEGIGSSQVFNRGEASEEFVREFDEADIFKRTPMKVPVVTNYIAETLLITKEIQPSKLAGVEIDWKQYFIKSWGDISLHERNGVNVKADREEFLRVLSLQPAGIQASVRAAIEPPPPDAHSPLRKTIRKLINSSSVLTGLESLVRGPEGQSGRGTDGTPVVIRGDDAGFRDILECARRLPDLLPRNRGGASL